MGKIYIGYGIGKRYESVKEKVKEKIKLAYLYDRKWEETDVRVYDGIPVIRKEEIRNFDDVQVIVFSQYEVVWESIKRDLEDLNVPYIHVNDFLGYPAALTGKTLKEKFPSGRYRDIYGNEILFDRTLPDQVVIRFRGAHNRLVFGKNLLCRKLNIYMGHNGVCSIGDETVIQGAEFFVSNAALTMGEACLLASEVIIRTHDGHPVFDRKTHERVNYEKDVTIGRHVWIASRAQLLSGAEIGSDSVIGAGSTVTSGKYEGHVILAGVPARVVRHDICWDDEALEYKSSKCLEEIYGE